MYRPGGTLDPPCYATQRIYETPENTRPKKWSSKLKLNTSGSSKSSEKSPESPCMYGTVNGPPGSALSKSMKYAETWLYGSVRTPTSPARASVFSTYPEVSGPVLISTPQKPTPHNYAVILCSCPEYLNGTKKTNSTKVSICKKCKGSRLPLTIAESPRILVGGTVRGSHVSRETGLLRAGTVRVQNTKARPSILKSNGDPADPYDLMRRSRLAPPHETRIGSQFSTTRSRAKSISPCRVKNKNVVPETFGKSRSKSVSRVNEIWVDEDANANEYKKSILSCDINPYDLVKSSVNSKSLAEIEFDDDFGDVFQDSLKHKNFKEIRHSKSDSNVKAISGQRIRVSNETKSSSEETSAYKSNNDLKNSQSKNQDASPSLSLPNIKNESKRFVSLSKNSSKKILNISSRTKPKSVSPKRPPRRNRSIKIEDDSESDNQKLPERNCNRKIAYESSRNSKHKNLNNDPIKSILKKPKNYNGHDSNTKTETSDDLFDNKRTNSSQFYLPKPNDKSLISPQNMIHRKRVQFLVENEETKVIYTAELNLQDNIEEIILLNTKK
ncbi:unnamed protein product [Parnassius apollo]|uniref:(apollo) hypothetical protein n=1 Tax=Parnassius apollo TaxID=110799 RepID=A0A8S3XIE6_PARAO|nr:unnamed protein product [Parnassius apollo]